MVQPSSPNLRMLFLGPGPWRLFAWLRTRPVLDGFAAPVFSLFSHWLDCWHFSQPTFLLPGPHLPHLSIQLTDCRFCASWRPNENYLMGLNPDCKSPNEWSIQKHSSLSPVHFLRQVDPDCCWHGNCSVQGHFCSWLQILVANKSSTLLIIYLCKELVKRQLPSWFTTTCRWKPVLERILAVWKQLCIQIIFFALIENCMDV